MARTPSKELEFRRCPDGYYGAFWIDDDGRRREKSFGKQRDLARTRFSRFRAEWIKDRHVRNPDAEGPLTISQAWDRFYEHAKGYYRRQDGTPTVEAECIRVAFQPLVDQHGALPARDFGPRLLKQIRETMVGDGGDDDLCLNTINARVRKIRHVFKWLASEELVPESTWRALQSVQALAAGRCEARVTDPVVPVPDPYVWEVCKHVPPTVETMIRLQWLTGMRPEDVCYMRPIDIDVSDKVWLYRPYQHKTLHRGKTRIVPLGPQAQDLIQPFLDRCAGKMTAYLFSPRLAMRERYSRRKTHRHQDVLPPRTKRRLGDHYEPKVYGHCIADVCRKHEIPHWSPNQLRHNFATRWRGQFGIEAASVGLGHARVDTTEIYAERNLARLVELMERVG